MACRFRPRPLPSARSPRISDGIWVTMAKAQRPQITTLTAAQLEALLAQMRPLVPTATYQLIAALLQTLQWIMAAFEQKTISIARLKDRKSVV